MLWGPQAAEAVAGSDCGAPAYWRRVVSEGFRPAMNLRGRAGWITRGRSGHPVTVHDGLPFLGQSLRMAMAQPIHVIEQDEA